MASERPDEGWATGGNWKMGARARRTAMSSDEHQAAFGVILS